MEHFQLIYDHAMNILENNVPDYYTYHNAEHTRYVLEKAIFLAGKEKLDAANLFLLKVAALYHDIGFTVGRQEHERSGCEIARQDLPRFGFSDGEINTICGMIMATKVPQRPVTLADKILADADLEYLSTRHFRQIGTRLFKELKYFNPDFSDEAWLELQVTFISEHRYHTSWCRKYRERVKRTNLKLLIAM